MLDNVQLQARAHPYGCCRVGARLERTIPTRKSTCAESPQKPRAPATEHAICHETEDHCQEPIAPTPHVESPAVAALAKRTKLVHTWLNVSTTECTVSASMALHAITTLSQRAMLRVPGMPRPGGQKHAHLLPDAKYVASLAAKITRLAQIAANSRTARLR